MSENVLPDTLAKEAKQDTMITELQSLLTKLTELDTAFDGTDFATQTTLEAARVLLASLDGKDYATESTLSSLTTAVTSGATQDDIRFYHLLSMMSRMLVQLKLITMQLASITDDELQAEDIED